MSELSVAMFNIQLQTNIFFEVSDQPQPKVEPGNNGGKSSLIFLQIHNERLCFILF